MKNNNNFLTARGGNSGNLLLGGASHKNQLGKGQIKLIFFPVGPKKAIAEPKDLV